MKNNQKWFVLISVVVSTLIICVKEWETLLHLNISFFGNYHDALKNYYTVLYHIKWDESYWIFEGMNYPYGEHVLFTDNQPLLSGILKFIHENLFPVAGYTLGIINGLMFLGLVLTTLFSHLCLQKLGVNKWLAIAAAVGLTFLSPQIPRINAHYALSYSFIIPLLIYQALLFLEKPQLRRSIFIALIIIAVSFLHAYYFGFGLVIFAGLFGVSVFYKGIPFRSKILHFALQVVTPLVLVEMIMVLSDHVSDRPAYPWSPFISNYNLHGIFFPLGKPIGTWIGQNFGLPQVDWESVTYVGAFASLFFLLGLITLPFFFLFKKTRLHPLVNPAQKMNFLLAAGLLSFVIPILYSVLSSNVDLYQLMGPFRQFRAVTRFNWVFFFAVNFYAFAWLSQTTKDLKSFWKVLIIMPIVGFLTYDAYWQSKGSFHTTHRLTLMLEESEAQLAMEEKLAGYDVLLPVPYFHIGSEDFVFQADPEHYKNAMAISHSAGVPMTAVMLSRTSLQQTLASLSYKLIPVEEPPFAAHLENKNVALLIHKNQPYSPQEQLLIDSGKDTLEDQENYYLQEFDLSTYLRLFGETTPWKTFTTPDTTGLLVYHDYEKDTTHSYTGRGSLSIPEEMPRPVGTFEINYSNTQPTYAGFWVYLYQQTKALESLQLNYLDMEGNLISTERYGIRWTLKGIDGKWGYVEFRLSPPVGKSILEIQMNLNTLHPTTTYIDAFRIFETPPDNL